MSGLSSPWLAGLSPQHGVSSACSDSTNRWRRLFSFPLPPSKTYPQDRCSLAQRTASEHSTLAAAAQAKQCHKCMRMAGLRPPCRTILQSGHIATSGRYSAPPSPPPHSPAACQRQRVPQDFHKWSVGKQESLGTFTLAPASHSYVCLLQCRRHTLQPR